MKLKLPQALPRGTGAVPNWMSGPFLRMKATTQSSRISIEAAPLANPWASCFNAQSSTFLGPWRCST